MSATPGESNVLPRLSRDQWAELERLVKAFEEAWVRGDRPSISDHAVAGPLRGRQLVELAHTDLEFRHRAGEPVDADGYLALFPELAGLPAAAAGLRDAARELNRMSATAPADESILAGLVVETRSSFADDTRKPGAEKLPYVAGRPAQPVAPRLPRPPGYEVLRELGRGGMGLVYEAVEDRLGRHVALKTVRPGAGEEETERLRREATAAAALEHPNVARVYQVFEHAGAVYVSGEYLSGGSLAERTKGEPLPAGEAAGLLEPLARAVGYAHSQGVVHRDLKPQNVLLDAHGTPKVCDFGLARRLDRESDLTRTGVVAGSPSYMAPEQAAGGKDVGPSADVWALGAILYELLTGRPPFRGATALDTLELVRGQEPVAPSRLIPRLPRDIETVCLKCIEKDPAKRYASAGALAEDLARFRRGGPVLAKSVGRTGRAWRWARRNRAVATLLALLAAAVVSGTGGSLWYAADAKTAAEAAADSEGRAKASEGLAKKNEAAALASERYAKRLLFASDMQAAATAVREGDPVRAAELLDTHAEERDGPYAFVWNHLDRLARVPGEVIDRLDGPAYFVCVSPDGKTLAVCGAAGEVRVYATAAWKPLGRWDAGQGELNGLAFSPDGATLLSAGDDGTVTAWDWAARRQRWQTTVFERQAYQAVYGLGGEVIAACGNDRSVRLLEPASGETVAAFEADPHNVEAVTVTPDGRTLLVAGYDGEASAWDLVGRRQKWAHRAAQSFGRFLSVSAAADGRAAAFGTTESTLLLCDPDTGRVLHQGPLPGPRPVGGGADCRRVIFLPDGTLVAARDGGLLSLARMTDRGLVEPDAARRAWATPVERCQCLAAGPDGTLLTAGWDGGLAAWRPAASPPWRAVRHDVPGRPEVTWVEPPAPVPPRLAVSTEDGVSLVDPETGATEPLVADGVERLMVAPSPDGRRLFAGSRAGRAEAWDVGGAAPRLLWRRDFDAAWRIRDGAVSRDGGRLFAQVVVRPNGDGRGFKDVFSLLAIDATSGTQISRRELCEHACEPAVSGDGRFVATSRDEAILLLGQSDLRESGEIRGHSETVKSVAFSPDGRRLASAANDGRVILWDVERRTQVRAWRPDLGEVWSVAFSPDGRMLLTATEDHPPRLWDVETGRLLLEPGSLPADARAGRPHWWPAFFTPDGTRIVAGCREVTAVLDGRPLLE